MVQFIMNLTGACIGAIMGSVIGHYEVKKLIEKEEEKERF